MPVTCSQMLRTLLLLTLGCGATTIAVAQPLPALIPYTDGEKWGYADTTGRVQISPQWNAVHFFTGDRARVFILQERQGWRHAVINRAGRYIIPPLVGWTGKGGTWADGLNAMDSAGRWGLVDTATGAMIVPHRWGPPGYERLAGALRDSFMVVSSGGLAGLINRRGEFVIQPVWGAIAALPGLEQDSLLIVADPDNMQGPNNKGLVSLSGRRVLPTRYQTIRLLALPDGGAVFHLATASLSAGMHGYAAAGEKWVDAFSGKEVQRPANAPQHDLTEQREPGGYISFGSWGYPRGLMDAKRNIVFPCCSVMKVTPDTIFLREAKEVGEDSLVYTSRTVDARTLKTLGTERQMVLHREKPRPREEFYAHHPIPHHEPVRIETKEWGGLQRFYKDSLLYSVQGYATASARKLYMVVGDIVVPKPGQVSIYYAVVDSDMNYIVGPLPHRYIIGYNPEYDLLIGQGIKGGKSGTTVLSRNGQALIPPPDEEIADAFRWRGNVYAYTVVRRESEIEYSHYRRERPIAEVHLIDTSGARVQALTRYRIAPWFGGSLPGSFRGTLPIPVLDTANRVSFVWPDGKLAYPKISSRYKGLQRVAKDWYLADAPSPGAAPVNGRPYRPLQAGSVRILLDGEGRRLAKGFAVHQLVDAFYPSNLFTQNNEPHPSIPRLYFATGAEEASGKNVQFFIDDRGRVYHAAAR